MMGPDDIIIVFWMLSFKPGYSLFFFTLIKRLFSSSLLSAMRVVSSAYLRLLILLPAILIPACDSSNLACVLKRNYIQNTLFIIHFTNSNFFSKLQFMTYSKKCFWSSILLFSYSLLNVPDRRNLPVCFRIHSLFLHASHLYFREQHFKG